MLDYNQSSKWPSATINPCFSYLTGNSNNFSYRWYRDLGNYTFATNQSTYENRHES